MGNQWAKKCVIAGDWRVLWTNALNSGRRGDSLKLWNSGEWEHGQRQRCDLSGAKDWVTPDELDRAARPAIGKGARRTGRVPNELQ